MTRALGLWLLSYGFLPAQHDPAEIMRRVAANVESAEQARTQYVYHQRIRASLIQSNGETSRKEDREYTVFPGEKRTEKKLVSFKGEYRKGRAMLTYSKPGFKTKDNDIDGALMKDLTDGLVSDKDSRDGIPHSLFPLRTEDLSAYRFSLKGEAEWKGRRTYQILFEPLKKDMCIHATRRESTDCDGPSWKGEAWIDAEELQPVRIDTQLAFAIPWGVRVFLGTNFRQTGFSITYHRAGANVWFPVTYGTEFRFNVLWGYRRTLTLAMENTAFEMAAATSTIEYDLPKQ